MTLLCCAVCLHVRVVSSSIFTFATTSLSLCAVIAAPCVSRVNAPVDGISDDIGQDHKHGIASYHGDSTNGWRDLNVPPEELRPAVSLTIGQCFNWRQATPDVWVGLLGSEVVAIRCGPIHPVLSLLPNAIENHISWSTPGKLSRGVRGTQSNDTPSPSIITVVLELQADTIIHAL